MKRRQRRTGARLIRVPVLCAALVLSGCGSSEVVTVDLALDRVQTQLATDYRELLDDAGLVVNPTRSGDEPLDLYASSLLLEARTLWGDALDDVDLAALTPDDVDEYRTVTHTPEEWVVSSLATLTRVTGRATEVDPAPVESPRHSDPYEESAIVRGIAEQAAAGFEVDRTALHQRLDALATAGDGGAIVAWRVEESCRLLQLACTWTTQVSITPDVESVGGILELRAAAELNALGHRVEGWAPSDVAADARAALAQLRDGEDLLASTLSRLLALSGGERDAFDAYLGRAAVRRDAATGLYRLKVHAQGTIGGTYEAMLTLGDHFAELVHASTVDGAPGTAGILTRLLTDGTDLAPADRARALAILAALGPLPGDLAAQVDDLAAVYAHTTLTAKNSAEHLAVLEALQQLDVDLGGVSVEPWPLTDEDERTINRILAMAQDGEFRNSAVVLDAYADHRDGLVRATLALPDDSPLFLSRLRLIANQPPEDLSPDDESELRARLEARRGCAASSAMYRISTDATAPCELGITRDAIHSGFAF